MKRILIAWFILTTLILTACTPTPAAPTQNEGQAGGAAPASVALDFAGWNYDSEKAHDILKNYENWIGTQYDPKMNVSVTMADSGYGEYDTFITTNYAGGGKYDALYSSDHWLAKWAEAGWILPLEDYFPKAKEYMKDMSPFSVNALTYKGKVYGLPYYSDVMYFVYNENMLKEAGIVAPPTTWAEVTEQSLLLKEKGISETPLLIGLQAGSWFDEAFFALAYSEGGDFFDENNNPIFETDKGPIFDMMEWLVESIHETEILPKKVMEMAAPNVQEAFKNGEAAFVIVPGYMMKEFNTPGISKIAGSAKISMMPGTTHATNGFTRLYVLGSGALENEETMAASLALIEYLGGSTTVDGTTTYHVAKRWSVENNLGFSANPLWNDPDVEKVFSSMADPQILAKQKALAQSKDGMQAPWFAEWISFVRTEVQKALLGESSTTTVLESVKQQWVELSQE